jgi:hypothetical protein
LPTRDDRRKAGRDRRRIGAIERGCAAARDLVASADAADEVDAEALLHGLDRDLAGRVTRQGVGERDADRLVAGRRLGEVFRAGVPIDRIALRPGAGRLRQFEHALAHQHHLGAAIGRRLRDAEQGADHDELAGVDGFRRCGERDRLAHSEKVFHFALSPDCDRVAARR